MAGGGIIIIGWTTIVELAGFACSMRFGRPRGHLTTGALPSHSVVLVVLLSEFDVADECCTSERFKASSGWKI